LREWAAQVSAVYRDSYLRASGSNAPDEARRLIEFFTLETALYKITYELANRPDWVSIPLNVLERHPCLIGAGGPPPHAVNGSDVPDAMPKGPVVGLERHGFRRLCQQIKLRNRTATVSVRS
jgi:hypothetical protein